jgi:hypothetical protein
LLLLLLLLLALTLLLLHPRHAHGHQLLDAKQELGVWLGNGVGLPWWGAQPATMTEPKELQGDETDRGNNITGTAASGAA